MSRDGVAFGLGCVNLGADRRRGVRLVHRALDLGVSFFDTADAYGAGSSEETLGRALRGRRDRATIATKAGYLFRERSAAECTARELARRSLRIAGRVAQRSPTPSALTASRSYRAQDFSVSYLRSALEASLRRLGTDHVDLFQLHAPRQVCRDGVLGLMDELRSDGKIRGFGVGLEALDNADGWIATRTLSHIQIPFGVLDPEAGEAVIPLATAAGVSVIARGIFAGGLLAPRSPSVEARLRPGQPGISAAVESLAASESTDAYQVAAWFVTTRPGVSTVLVGTSTSDHLEQSLRYVRSSPPERLLPWLDALPGAAGERGGGQE